MLTKTDLKLNFEKQVSEKVQIIPKPGLVLKSSKIVNNSIYNNKKLFINVVYSNEIPLPFKIEVNEKVPMSISQLKSSLDKKGNVCVVFDVMIHQKVYEKTREDEEYLEFIIQLVRLFVEKYGVECEDLVILKMRQKGELSPHLIDSSRRVLVSDVTLSHPVDQVEPNYLIAFDDDDNPKYMAIQVNLPLLENSKQLQLELEEKLLFLECKEYKLNLKLPEKVNVDDVGAQFDCTSKYLHVSLTVNK